MCPFPLGITLFVCALFALVCRYVDLDTSNSLRPHVFFKEAMLLKSETYLPLFIQKKAMRWRKGATLESLLIENSE